MAKTMVVVCMDPRYRKGEKYEEALHDFLVSIGADKGYLISVAGASLQYIQPEHLDGIKKRVETARWAGVERYILIDHLTCAAYKLHFGPLELDAEIEKHKITTEAAKEWHTKNAPDIAFEMYIQNDDDPTHFEKID